jgi:CBS domain containing-hemolysin-like protein
MLRIVLKRRATFASDKDARPLASLPMKRSPPMLAATVVGAITLAALALGTSATQPYACPQLEAGWGVLNLLQAQQALRVIAAFMTVC